MRARVCVCVFIILFGNCIEFKRVRVVMAYINVELWSSDQVTDWLKGEQKITNHSNFAH